MSFSPFLELLLRHSCPCSTQPPDSYSLPPAVQTLDIPLPTAAECKVHDFLLFHHFLADVGSERQTGRERERERKTFLLSSHLQTRLPFSTFVFFLLTFRPSFPLIHTATCFLLVLELMLMLVPAEAVEGDERGAHTTAPKKRCSALHSRSACCARRRICCC